MRLRSAPLPLFLAAAACGDPVPAVPGETDATGSSTGTDSIAVDGTTSEPPSTTDGSTGPVDPTSTTAVDTSSGSAESSASDDGTTETTGPTCGDGMLDAGEACDGEDLGGATCESQGFERGVLACTAGCQLDTSGCQGCGDEVLDDGEECDTFELGGQSCESLGFDAGVLGCTAECTFDTSVCYLCGNGFIDPTEECDQADLSGQTCADLGFDAGALGCTPECTFETTGCTPPYTIDFCRLQFPLSIDAASGSDVVVYGRLYVAGLTDQSVGNDVAPSVGAWVGYGPDGSDPAVDPSWVWLPAVPNPGWDGSAFGEPNNDEYQATLLLPPPGSYDYAYRFSGDSGGTFTYCDGDPGGSTTGYDPTDAGQLTSAP